MKLTRFLAAFLIACCTLIGSAYAADTWGLKAGTPQIKSAGPLAFGPDGILLLGDTKAATVFAIATGDTKGDAEKAKIQLEGLQEKVAELLGAKAGEITINDLAVNPETGNVYLSVTKGTGPNAAPAVVKVDVHGKLSKLSLDKATFAKVALPNPPEDKTTGEGRRARNLRDDSITDLAYVSGKVLVSGISTNASPSTVRELPFPFTSSDTGASVEIYHAAHGRVEDYAAIRTFVPFTVDGEPTLLAGFVCTPLVKFPLSELKAGEKTRGTTVAELGNLNRPLDMIAYQKDGKDYLLMANSARGVMKISTQDIAKNEGLTQPVKGGGTAGQSFETIKDLKGVVQLDRLNDGHAVILVQADGGPANLQTIALP
jgi:hypothetical protein